MTALNRESLSILPSTGKKTGRGEAIKEVTEKKVEGLVYVQNPPRPSTEFK